MHKRHPQNVSGVFYIAADCCTRCGMLEECAPSLVGQGDDDHCIITRQPETPDEIYQAILGIGGSEFGCLRYGGHDPDILERLGELGYSYFCDHPLEYANPLGVRTHVSFDLPKPTTPAEIAQAFQSHLLALPRPWLKLATTPVEIMIGRATFKYSWSPTWHTISVAQAADGTWLMNSTPPDALGALSVAVDIHAWLSGVRQATNLRWYTVEAWQASADTWRATPC